MYNSKLSKDPFESTINDLKMFEQTKYCFEYIKQENNSKSDKEIMEHAKIASACFRQASEYYKAAISVSLCTSPLLFSYALNNILKGTSYLKTFDNKIISGFSTHGFSIKNASIYENILKSKIQVKEHGAVGSLLKLFGNSIETQEIEFYKILRHIPGIMDTYFKSTGKVSLLAIKDKNDASKYIIKGNGLDAETSSITKEFGILIKRVPREESCYCYLNTQYENNIEENYSKSNIFYRNYLNIPDIFKEGIKDINITFYCYLLIMAYGMLVRYNADKWENFIDKKDSKDATLIELSLNNAVINFYYQMHYILFNYYYEEDSYNDLDVKKVIRESTKDIMNNITEEINHYNLQCGRHEQLPWHENYG